MLNIKWLGHASFALSNGKHIYIDPWQIKEKGKADLILITHDHFDHCSVEDIEKLSTKETSIVATPSCQATLSGLEVKELKLIKPDDCLQFKDIKITALPAYNTNKSFHPKGSGLVGYLIEFEGKTIYHAGDTDFIPEMKGLKGVDVALVPVSGTYVMTAEEAAQAVNSFNPKKAIPMHYGSIVGSVADAKKFKKLATCEVEIF